MATTPTTTLKAASTQPATGVGSLAETNRLLSLGASNTTAPTSGGTTASAGKQVYTVNGQKVSATSQDAANQYFQSGGLGKDPTTGTTTPVSSAPITPPTTPTNTPVDTKQPSPTNVDATPYTAGAPAVVSDAQAQANLAKGGLTGDALASAETSLNAYQQGHAAANASGAPAPQNPGVGMSAATTAAANATTTYTPAAPVVQAYTDATKKLTDDYNKAMSTSDQGKTLVDQYKQFTQDLGIPALNTQLINMKNVIDGTEDDIRNEVTKAGGFATESQVLAMTNARNKTMIQNYNNLLQTRSDMQQQVQTMVGLAAQDRTYMSAQIDRQLNFDQQQVSFAEKALTNAQSSIQKSIDTYGAASVYKQALATGDPTAVARINATMGNGFDLHSAAAAPTLDEQVKQANIAQSKASTAASYSTIAKNNYDMGQTTVKAAAAQKAGAQTADNVLTAVKTAQSQVGYSSTGLAGTLTGWLGGTPAKNLATTVDTIKSNLAFSELQKMRDNSPTGGALGQVSEGEEKLLSSTVASLDTSQSPAQLTKNLRLVQQHYVNYLQSLGYGYDEATGNVITP